MQALQLFIPGDYEDAFVYMDQILAVGTDRSLLRMNLSELLDDTVPASVRRLAYLWFERNDLLSSPGTQALLSDQNVRQVVESSLASNADAFLVEPKWTTSDDYERLLGGATVLDLQIYAQRVFVGTTQGMLHANLINDGYELHFAGVTKRTDARCVGVSIRYGAVAASCEDDGLLMSFDEFGELELHSDDALEQVATVSQRSAWLGYNIVNYRDSSHAEGLRARYRTVPERNGRRRDVVLTDLEADDDLLGPMTEEWDDHVDFVFNAFAVLYPSRKWSFRSPPPFLVAEPLGDSAVGMVWRTGPSPFCRRGSRFFSNRDLRRRVALRRRIDSQALRGRVDSSSIISK